MKKEKLELEAGRKTLLNKCIVMGTEKGFVKMIDYLERQGYDTIHYKNTYRRIKEEREV